MSDQINNGLNNMDDYLRDILDNYQAEPSPNLWGKVNHKLFKKDVSEFIRFKKLKKSFDHKSNTVSMQIKVWTSYAAAALLAVGFVYGSTVLVSKYIINKPETKTNNVSTPVIPNPINAGVKEIDSVKTPDNIISPSENNPNNYLNKKQNTSNVSNNSNIVSNGISQESNIAINSPIEKAQPIESSNYNTLVDYIQKMNPENKISKTENTDETPDEDVVIENNIATFRKDTLNNELTDSEYEIEIPNVITPNGDSFNDVLIIKNLDKFTDKNLHIADRNGKVVYQSNSYQNDWDAQNVADGTYYYIFSCKDKKNVKKVVKGMITVIRK